MLVSTTDTTFLSTDITHSEFSKRVLLWFYEHGRHDLPWQNLSAPFDPYPVWVSEIMLQQTQVATVIGYYTRFMARFNTLFELAQSPLDDVIEHWAGLGYYARARNLHKTAKALADILQKTGDYPQTVQEWQALAGIGRSTAGAIMAMGLGKFGVICDGNVKRVLTRWAGIDGDITKSATDKVLWQLAETLTPKVDSGKYAQAMMDLGATVCTKTRPNCAICPVSSDCVAFKNNNPTAYPVKAKKTDKPHRHSLVFAIMYNDNILWLKRHSPTGKGIWDGLYALPMLMIADSLTDTPADLYHAKSLHEHLPVAQPLSLGEMQVFDTLLNTTLTTNHTIKHTLTHFHWHLSLTPIQIDTSTYTAITHALQAVNAQFVWQADSHGIGIPRAMEKLLLP